MVEASAVKRLRRSAMVSIVIEVDGYKSWRTYQAKKGDIAEDRSRLLSQDKLFAL
jgi:hypothetical protein